MSYFAMVRHLSDESLEDTHDTVAQNHALARTGVDECVTHVCMELDNPDKEDICAKLLAMIRMLDTAVGRHSVIHYEQFIRDKQSAAPGN